MAGFTWSAIVLTCPGKSASQVLLNELRLRQQHGILSESTLLLSVEDPQGCVGSGGATLNALLVVTEHMSARQGYTVVNADVLQNAHILMLHVGRSFPLDPCSRAFVNVGITADNSELPMCNLDLLIDTITTQVAHQSPPGVWVCSTDMFLHLVDAPKLDYEGVDAVAVSVLASTSYASQHGVYKVDKENVVEDIIFRGSESALSRCAVVDDQVPLVTGVVYLSTRLADRLLAFHVTPPLDACTYMGIDSGAKPIQLSLFFDILLALSSGVSKEDYVSGQKSAMYIKHLMRAGDTEDITLRQKARTLMWNQLQNMKLRVWPVPSGSHSYMTLSPATHHKHLLCPVVPQHLQQNNQAGAFVSPGASVSESAVLINSLVSEGANVGDKTALSHCFLSVPVTIGKDSIVNGVYTIGLKPGVTFADSLVLQTFHITLPALSKALPVVTVFGRYDDLKAARSARSSTMCNNPWVVFFGLTGITQEDLWDPSVSDYDQCLYNAKLFPVLHSQEDVGWEEIIFLQGGIECNIHKETMLKRWRNSWRLSLEEILGLVNIEAEFEWRRRLQCEYIGEQIVRDTLLNGQDRGLNQLYRHAVVEGYAKRLLCTLDEVACMAGVSAGIAARSLANIADVLGAMAEGTGGLRSGPAANAQWTAAFQLLEDERIKEGVRALAEVRENWLDRPERLVRAARHYEGAAQILIRRAVLTARQFVRTVPCTAPDKGQWVQASCPARIDIAGGWSDTPPITYEHGGAVMDAAITVDGKKPIGAKVKKIDECELWLNIGGGEGDGQMIKVTKLDELADYNQPHSPGALLKAAFLCAEIVQYPFSLSLAEQLRTRYGGGFQLHTWSNLPHGSGLGTSSILAGAVMAVLWHASGQQFDIHSLNHAVLHLEQMLTTGGGWQDQVGGLTGGIKLATSPAQLPLRVDVTYPSMSAQTIQEFSERLILVYTGRTRLARNLLQNVLRTWYARDPAIVATEDSLVDTAHKCADAFTDGKIEEVGRCMLKYWELKKHMAPGCEPEQVARMMDALAPHTYGTCMAGAGGGGFLYVLCKLPHSETLVRTLLKNIEGCENVTVHKAEVDMDGMVLSVEGQGNVHVPLHNEDMDMDQ